jgi:hypothetical protein
MLSDIAGDVSRCISSRKAFLNGDAKQDYSLFWLQRVLDACNNEIDESELPEFLDEVNEIREYLKGNRDEEYILRYWKQYEQIG